MPQTFAIKARPQWNDTGVRLTKDARYRLTAEGVWCDASIKCGPDGYVSSNLVLRLTESMRRAPTENWFALIGAIDRDLARAFKIGTAATIVAGESGALACFANDLPLMYWNNSGQVLLTIEQIG